MNRGFTLIELLIVIAIIGVLAAIAIPSYQDYVTRGQVTEAVALLGGFKAPLSEYGVQRDAWPTAIIAPAGSPTTTEITGTLVGNYASVASTVVGAYPNGTLTATMSAGRAVGNTIKLATTDGGSVWTCTGGTVPSQYRPEACR